MITKKYYFLAGLPRSGSTVLASILGQHPDIYATPTSPLLDLLFFNDQNWLQNQCVIANKFPEQQVNLARGIFNSCWEHRREEIILDKHRAWGRNIGIIKALLDQEPKVIITVRDIPSILASFMTLLRKSKTPPTYIDHDLTKKRMALTDENRVDCLWNDYILDGWDSAKTGWEQHRNNVLVVEYDDLIKSKQDEIARVYRFLGLPLYEHDFDNIINEHNDDDLVAWGLEGLHDIRPELKKTSKNPEEILGSKIYKKYADMKLEFWR